MTQRQGQLLDRLVDTCRRRRPREAPRPATTAESRTRRRGTARGRLAGGSRLLARSCTRPHSLRDQRRQATARGPRACRRSRSRGRPAAFSLLGELARLAARRPGLAASAARARRTSSSAIDRDGRVEGVLHLRLEQQRHLDHGDLDVGRSEPAPGPDPSRRPAGGTAPPASEARRDRRRRSRRPGRGRRAPPGATSAPQRSTSRCRAAARESSSSCTTASLESVAAPSALEGSERLGLAGRDPAGKADRQRHRR